MCQYQGANKKNRKIIATLVTCKKEFYFPLNSATFVFPITEPFQNLSKIAETRWALSKSNHINLLRTIRRLWKQDCLYEIYRHEHHPGWLGRSRGWKNLQGGCTEIRPNIYYLFADNQRQYKRWLKSQHWNIDLSCFGSL